MVFFWHSDFTQEGTSVSDLIKKLARLGDVFFALSSDPIYILNSS
jgi:hypothetical protein